MTSVSVVITTYRRADMCERALASALDQDPAPLEVLVCDNASNDDTADRIGAWASRDSRVRLISLDVNRGTPAPARNAGIAAATGDWLAFLDDDDEWLPGKLATQLEYAGDADVIASNAVTRRGGLYFSDAPEVHRPDRREILTHNPVIFSTALVRRSVVLDAGGLMDEPWAGGVEDWALWLTAADRGARFLILGEPLVRYENVDPGRLSAQSARQERTAARLAWRRVRAKPADPALYRAALNRTVAAAREMRRG